MALDFPLNPADGDIHEPAGSNRPFVYNAAHDKWTLYTQSTIVGEAELLTGSVSTRALADTAVTTIKMANFDGVADWPASVDEFDDTDALMFWDNSANQWRGITVPEFEETVNTRGNIGGAGGGDNFLDYGSNSYTSGHQTTTTHTTGDTTWNTTGNVLSVAWRWSQASVQYIGGAGGLRQARLRISFDGGGSWTTLDDHSQGIGGGASNIGWDRSGTAEIPNTPGVKTVKMDILVNNGQIDSAAGRQSTQTINSIRVSDTNVTTTTGIY